MSKPYSVLLKSTFSILFVYFAVPAFAQHGGGGHMGGGGFHGGGGGGFHGAPGGGFHGGGVRGGSPYAGYSGARSAPAPAPRSMGGYATRPGGNFTGGNQRFGNSFSAPTARANG